MDFLGLALWEGDVSELMVIARDAVRGRKQLHIVTLNPEMVARQAYDCSFREALRTADLLVPDGIGIVWAARFLQRKILRRLPGIELAEHMIARGEKEKWSFYFLGGEPGVAEGAIAHLCRRYPRLQVVGFHHGYFQDHQRIVRDINEREPDVLLVGMGSPYQEMWIHRYRSSLVCRVMVGVGGSFDVWSGKKKRAPRVWQAMRLEWGYRLLQEPWRIHRVAPAFLRFLWLVLGEKFRLR